MSPFAYVPVGIVIGLLWGAAFRSEARAVGVTTVGALALGALVWGIAAIAAEVSLAVSGPLERLAGFAAIVLVLVVAALVHAARSPPEARRAILTAHALAGALTLALVVLAFWLIGKMIDAAF